MSDPSSERSERADRPGAAPRGLGLRTRAARAHADGHRGWRPLSPPLYQATNFQFPSSRALGEAFRAKDAVDEDRVYLRFGHPTLSAVSGRIAALEGAEAALLFGSGMAAITSSLIATLEPGDHVVAQRQIFAQTYTFLDRLARSWGIETTFVEATDPEAVGAALRPQTALIYVETPSNPRLEVVDIEALAAIAREAGAALFVDSTFATPVLQSPLALGADLVLHSGTKYLGGHSDVMAGVAAGSRDRLEQVKRTQTLLGGVLDPHAAWLLDRGVRTLGLRVERQSENALAVARYLAGRPGIEAVHYPWLEDSLGYEVASRQMRGGGGMVSFRVKGGLEAARCFVDALRLIPIATSLGGVETIVEIPYELDFGADELGLSADDSGVDPGLIRLSVGCEDVDDLLTDLDRGVEALGQGSLAAAPVAGRP